MKDFFNSYKFYILKELIRENYKKSYFRCGDASKLIIMRSDSSNINYLIQKLIEIF